MEQLSFNDNYVNFTTIYSSPESRPNSVDFFVKSTYTVIEFFSVILLTFGYVCNPISVAVMSRKPFRNTAMSVYLRFVAICDTLTLTNGLVSMFRLSELGRDIFRDMNICCLYYWTLGVSTKCSSWTLLAVTVERAISTARPHKVKAMCSAASAKVFVLLIVLLWGGVTMFVPFMLGHQNFTVPQTNITHTRICVLARTTPGTLFLNFFLDTAAYGIFPSVVLIICNVVIISSVIRSRNRVNKMFQRNRDHPKGILNRLKQKLGAGNESVKKKPDNNGRSKEMSLTVTLVFINTSYVLCNLPVVLYQLYHNFKDERKITVRDNAVYMLLFLVMYFNNILNFLLYFITGSRFRHELINMFVDIVHCLKSTLC
ncbi:unnamed protein product [Candidula unifasciata]|uniref:G-protein coupled receptors family 1 profile domain-containing protein n=1 Tax=Candidula unifasciata TaxID=100452 RepID=A0A8S3Z6I1_9EUPU|nr:unnamed protein product [Candidula unifasciata]